MFEIRSVARIVALLALSATVVGCANVPKSAGSNPQDPWESINRQTFAFNDSLDSYFMRPAAETYVKITPLPARINVSNALSNPYDVWIGFNNLLQGKPSEAGNDALRVLINTTIGILGFFDVASEMGLEKHKEDFGQTLAVWGVSSGPYIVMPLMGPSTVRDGVASMADVAAVPDWWVPTVPLQNSLLGVRTVNDRAKLLGAGNALKEASLDPYNYMRDFYLRYRQGEINDGRRQKTDEYEESAAEAPTKSANTEENQQVSVAEVLNTSTPDYPDNSK